MLADCGPHAPYISAGYLLCGDTEDPDVVEGVSFYSFRHFRPAAEAM